MTKKWIIDTAHSEIFFKVRHMVISTVTGTFNDFHAEAIVEGNSFETAEFNAAIEVNSISTKVEARDQHLKSEEFFYIEKFPQIFFESKEGIRNGELTGTIEIRGVKQPIHLNADISEIIVDNYGNKKVGIELSGVINRKTFGLNWNSLTEAGGVVVSDEVKVIANLQLTEEK